MRRESVPCMTCGHPISSHQRVKDGKYCLGECGYWNIKVKCSCTQYVQQNPFFDVDAPNCKVCDTKMECGFDKPDGSKTFVCVNVKCPTNVHLNRLLATRKYPLDKSDEDAVMRGEEVDEE